MADESLQTEKLRLLEVALAGAAHELNNQAQSIQLASRTIQETWKGLRKTADRYMEEQGDFQLGGLPYSQMRDELPGWFDLVAEGTGMLISLAAGMRGLAGSGGGEPEELSLNRLIEQVIAMVGHSFRRLRVYLVPDLSDDLPFLRARSQPLQLLLAHLVLDAAARLPEDARKLCIRTRSDAEGGMVVCELTAECSVRCGGLAPTSARLAGECGARLEARVEPGPRFTVSFRLPLSGGTAR